MELKFIPLLIYSLLVLPSFSASNEPNRVDAYVIIQVENTKTGREFSGRIELNVKAYPQRQVVREHGDVVFDCRDESNLRASIRWLRDNLLPLSSSAVVENGRLAMYGVRQKDAGVYICEAIDRRARTPVQRVRVTLEVEKARAEDRYGARENQSHPLQIPTRKLVTKPGTFIANHQLNLKIWPKDGRALENQNAIFDCRDESYIRAPVYWRRGNNLSLPSGAAIVNGRLMIPRVQLQDAGEYICEASSYSTSAPGQHVKLTLKVEKSQAEDNYEARATQSPPSQIPAGKLVTTGTFIGTNQLNLKIYPENRRALENQDAIFDCRDEGDLRVPVNWRRGNNLPLPSGAEVVNGRLMIPRVHLQDAGEYICEANGYSPSTPGQRVKFSLEVEPSRMATHGSYLTTQTGKLMTTPKSIETQLDQLDLRIYSENRTVKENENVVFVCRDESDQHAPVNWQRGNNLSLPSTTEVTNGWIKIRRVQLQDAGEYFCEAYGYSSFTLGQRVKFTLVVERTEEPELNCEFPGQETAENGERRLKIHPPYPLVKLHSEVTLNCYDEGHLPVSVHWRRRDNTPLPSGAVVRNGCLTIPEVQFEDAGFYICEATGNPRSTVGQVVEVILLIEKSLRGDR